MRLNKEITTAEFYGHQKAAAIMPTTSQVSVITMENIFFSLVDKEFDVLGVFIPEKLSGTIQPAYQGRELLGSRAGKVTIVDSNSTSMAMGFQVLAAGRIAEAGASRTDCVELIEKTHSHVGVYFAVDTLKFLHRGGRIGGAC